MNFNTILLRLGICPENFINNDRVAIPIDGGMLYEVDQQTTKRNCPHCKSNDEVINGILLHSNKLFRIREF